MKNYQKTYKTSKRQKVTNSESQQVFFECVQFPHLSEFLYRITGGKFDNDIITTINNDNSSISQAIIELDLATQRAGDSLVFENSNKYDINQDTGVVTLKVNNSDVGITINITNNNQTINLLGNSSAEIYQEIINLIKFVHVNQDNDPQVTDIITNVNITITNVW